MIVVDASAVVDLILRRGAGASVAQRIARERGVLSAPHLVDVEVARVLRRLEALHLLDSARADVALDDFVALGIERHAHDALLPRIWELRRNATAYDAAYLALAEAVDAPLITTDAKLVRVPGSRAKVELIR